MCGRYDFFGRIVRSRHRQFVRQDALRSRECYKGDFQVLSDMSHGATMILLQESRTS